MDEIEGSSPAETIRAAAWMNGAVGDVKHNVPSTIINRSSKQRGAANSRLVIRLGEEFYDGFPADDVVTGMASIEPNEHKALRDGPHELGNCSWITVVNPDSSD